MTTLRDELIRQVPRVFRALPPISDTDLFPPGFEFAGAGPWELAELRGRDRFEVARQVEWLDAGVVYRMSGYARWYFAPTFLLLMLHHIEQYQFEGLMRVFAYSPTVLEQMGLDPCASEIPPSFVPRVDMPQYVHDLSIEDCLPLTESRPTALDIHHFAVAASHFNVSVQARHLELISPRPEHRAHAEHGGRGVEDGDAARIALARHRRAERVRRFSISGRVNAAPVVDLSAQAATDAAATPRSGCSTASAAA